MHLNDYQKAAASTAIYPGQGRLDGLVYTCLGLTGEAGEFANKLKKVLRDGDGERAGFSGISDVRRGALLEELGDVLWYIAGCASELGVPLEEVAHGNLSKLLGRAVADALHGEGDER